MSVLKDWFRQYTPREQVYLLSAVAAVLLYALYQGIWRPVDGMREDMAQQNQRMAESVERVRAMATQLRELKSTGAARGSRNLNQLINSSTAGHGLRPSRIQPNSRGETQVRFEDVDFAALLRWLHQLEYVDSLPVLEVSINQGDRSGVVNASVRLGQGG